MGTKIPLLTCPQLKTLIGSIIIKFSTSVITCWGNINLYLLSAFHHQGTKITPQTNSFILLFSVPFMVIALLVANRLCRSWGHERVIRMGCFLFLVAPMASLVDFGIVTFTIFSILIPGTMYSLISIPVLNCIWTQFPSSKNRSTSLLVIAFGLGSIVWNFLFMHMINPQNQDTVDEHNQNQISFFREEVTSNVRKTVIVGFGVTGGLAFLGSLLLVRSGDYHEEDLKQQKQQPEIQSSKPTNSQQSLTKSPSTSLTYKQALTDQRFLIIMTISVLTGLYQIYLMTNFKIIFMPIIGDDHFLSYASMVCSVVSIGGAFLWGVLGDWKGVYFTILVLSVLDFGGKVYSDFAESKGMIVGMVVLIGLISKSMTTIAGPGFVEIFGLKLGTQLLPLKGVAIILGYILVPLLQIATSKFLDPHQYLICLSFMSVITVCCALRLYILKCRQDAGQSDGKRTKEEIQMEEKDFQVKTKQEQEEAGRRDAEISGSQDKWKQVKVEKEIRREYVETDKSKENSLRAQGIQNQ